MKNRNKSWWAYRFTYQPWDAAPNEVNMFKFGLHFLLTALMWGVYWLTTGIACFLFALKQGKDNEEDLVPINDWPTILGHRIWPLSLIGLGFMIWPFVNFHSWAKHGIIPLFSLISLIIFVCTVFTKKTWQEICEKTRIVFTENGKV